MKLQQIKMILIAFLFAIIIIPVNGFAETGTVTIASDTSLEVGDTFTVSVRYTSSSLGYIDGELQYNPDLLKFVSGTAVSNPIAGSIKMNSTLKGEVSQLYTIRFVAVGTGSNYFVVNTLQLKDVDSNDLGKPGASVKYSITDPTIPQAPEDPVIAPEDSVDEPVIENPTTTDDLANVDEEPLVDTENKTAPDTIWVFVGAIFITIILIIVSLYLVVRKKKSSN